MVSPKVNPVPHDIVGLYDSHHPFLLMQLVPRTPDIHWNIVLQYLVTQKKLPQQEHKKKIPGRGSLHDSGIYLTRVCVCGFVRFFF